MPSARTAMLQKVLGGEERAIDAVVARYARVAPAVARFARVVSDNADLAVRLGTAASARPGEVVLDPRMFAAAYARQAPVTPDEVALVSALHEVAHLLLSDFDLPVPADVVVPDLAPETLEDSETNLRLPPVLGYVRGVSARPHVAEALFFALEDARQERRFLTSLAFAGARSILDDIYAAALPDAVRRAEPLGQFVTGLFSAVGGYGSADVPYRDNVTAALRDAAPLVAAVADGADAWASARAVPALMDIAHRHRLIRSGPAADATRRAQAAADEADAAEAQMARDALDRVRLPATVVADAEGYEQVQQAAEAAASRGRPGAPEAAADHLLRVSQSPVVFLPSGMGGRLVLERLPTAFARDEDAGRTLLNGAAQRWGVAQRRVAGELFPLFVANQRRGLRSGFDAGDLSPHAPLLLGAGLYDRLYERRALPTRRNYAVSLLVDGSASMLQPRPVSAGRNETWGLAAALLGAWTLAHLCEELQVSFEVGIFNRGFAALVDDTEAVYLRRRAEATAGLRQAHGSSADALVSTVNHYLVKSFDDPWRAAEARLVGLADMAFRPKEAGQRAMRQPQESAPVSMFAKAANVDELNVVRAVERLAARRANVRVLVVLSDGMTRGRPGELALAVAAAERSGATILGIGIGDRAVEGSYRLAQVVYRPPALARAMVEGVRGALKRGLARAGVPVGT